MRNLLHALPALIAAVLILTSGVAAAAAALRAGSYATVQADVSASADTSGAQQIAHDTLGQARARAAAEASADAAVAGSVTSDAQSGSSSNVRAFGAWVRGLFGIASADTHLEKSVEVRDGGAQVHVESTIRVNDELVAPPRPDVGFVASFQAGVRAILHLG